MQAIRNIFRLILCLLLQMLVFNKLHFLGVCHPFIYILFLFALPISVPRWAELILGGLVGLGMDMICSSPGVHMAACSMIAYLRPILLNSLTQDTERISQDISSASIGQTEYVKLVVLLTAIHHTIVFMLDAWSLAHPVMLFIQIISSVAVSLALIIGWDALRN